MVKKKNPCPSWNVLRVVRSVVLDFIGWGIADTKTKFVYEETHLETGFSLNGATSSLDAARHMKKTQYNLLFPEEQCLLGCYAVWPL
jgi:hypothetical protein